MGEEAGAELWRGEITPCPPLLCTSHQSGEVSMGSFCRLPSTSGCFPCPLSALEEHNFLFQLRGGEQPPPGAKEGLEVPLIAVVQWSTPKLPFTQSIYTHYR